MPRRPRRRLVGLAGATLAALAVLLGAVAVANRAGDVGDTAASGTPPLPEAPCDDLPYQPCGQPVAVGTDGTTCLPGHADYDGDALNGCEAVSDTAAGEPFRSRIVANLVPADAVDEIAFRVDHSLNLFCDNLLEVSLTAPMGATMRLDVLSEGAVLGTAVSTDGVVATVDLDQPDCLGNTNRDLVARVSWVGERRTGENYLLTRRGLW